MAIEIEFIANLRNLLSGLKDGTVSFEDFEKAIDDAGDTSKDAGRTIEDSTSDATDSVDKTTEAAGNLGGALGDVGGIAKSAIEGDLGGAVEGVGRTIGGLAAAIPGVGAAVGVLASEGIGAIVSGLQQSQRDADELKARLAAAYQTATEEGRAYLDQAQIIKATTDILFGADQGPYQQAQRDAANLGLTVTEVVQAMAGDQDALNVVLARTNELEQERTDKLNSGLTPMELRATLNSAEAQALADINARYTAQVAIQDENIQKANEVLRLQGENLIQLDKQNDALARTPREVSTKLVVDDSALNQALQGRSIPINLRLLDRNGQSVD